MEAVSDPSIQGISTTSTTGPSSTTASRVIPSAAMQRAREQFSSGQEETFIPHFLNVPQAIPPACHEQPPEHLTLSTHDSIANTKPPPKPPPTKHSSKSSNSASDHPTLKSMIVSKTVPFATKTCCGSPVLATPKSTVATTGEKTFTTSTMTIFSLAVTATSRCPSSLVVPARVPKAIVRVPSSLAHASPDAMVTTTGSLLIPVQPGLQPATRAACVTATPQPATRNPKSK